MNVAVTAASSTLISLIANEAESSFVIVAVPVAVSIGRLILRPVLTKLLNRTENVSSSSTLVSPLTKTFTVLVVSPGAKVKVPFTAV